MASLFEACFAIPGGIHVLCEHARHAERSAHCAHCGEEINTSRWRIKAAFAADARVA